jgi:class 3 adenylate cyclase
VVTVVFADLVGFTALSEQLDPEDVAIVQDRYFRAARDAIESRSGQVEKFIGDAVVGTFGVRHATDEDPEQAVAAALAIVDAVEAIAAQLDLGPDDLHVRVGVNTGEVVVMHPSSDPETWRLAGDAVNVAARLQAAATPGTVLLGSDTALAVDHAFSMEPAGSLPLKGKALPVAAWRVIGRRPAPFPKSALQGLQAATVGREGELELLERTRAAAAERVEGLLLVAPPGVGKTRLVAEFHDRVVAAGGTSWTARLSYATARASGYDLVAQLLSKAVGPRQARTSRLLGRLAALGHSGPRAALSVEHALALLEGTALDAAPADLWTSWTAVLDACGGDRPRQPPVWLIEDVHLASPDERGFLLHALAEPHRRGRMVLMTARPAILGPEGDGGDGGADGDGRAPARLGDVPIAYLGPLEEADARRLVELLVGNGALPAHVAEALATASGGNPLFIEEVLRSWIQTGALRRSRGGWEFAGSVDRPDIPTSIRTIYLSQLDDLPDLPRRVVEAGSVPGTTFPSRALPFLGVSPADAALDLLTDYGLLTGPHPDVVDSASYTYRHALLREAAYGLLSRSSRAQLHLRFAEWVGQTLDRPAAAEIIGEHLAKAFEEAPALGTVVGEGLTRDVLRKEAAGWLERAGEVSMGAAPQRALELLEHALALTAPEEETAAARRSLRLAEASRRSGRLEDAMRAFAWAGEVAERAREDAVGAAAALGYEDALFESRLPRQAWGEGGRRLLSAALERATHDEPLHSRLLAALGRAQVYEGLEEQGEANCRLAVEAARRSGDDGALAYALLSLRAAESAPEQLPARLERIDELVEAAERAGDVESELEGVRLQFVDLLEAGDPVRAGAAQERAGALIQALRRPLFFWYPAMWRAMTALFRGELDAASTLIEEFRDEGRLWRYRDVELVCAVQTLQLHLERGTPELALPALRRREEAAPGRFAISLSAGLAHAGRHDEARQQLAVHAAHDFGTLPRDLSLAYALAQATEAAALLGDAPTAARLRTLLQPWDGHNIVLGSGAVALGAASHYIGLAARTAGDLDAARQHLSAAVAMNDAMGATPAATRSRLELARTLAGLGGTDEARTIAAEALAVARQCGLDGVAPALQRLLEEDMAA